MFGKRFWLELLAVLVLLGGLWIIFSLWIGDSAEQIQPPDVPVEREKQLGELLAGHLFDRFDRVDDPDVRHAIDRIEERLLKAAGPTDYRYKIHIIDSDIVNAAALPGGQIILFRGLLEFAESPDEVAAVLAHEIGHIENRHVIKKLGAELGISVLFSALSGGDPYLTSEIARMATSSAFSRTTEREADRYALQLLQDAEVNPRMLARFFRRLQEEEGRNSGFLQLLATHPHAEERVRTALEFELDETFESRPFDLDWDAVRGSL